MTDAGMVLICWLGGNDLNAMSGGPTGPVLSTLQAFRFQRLELLSFYPAAQAQAYRTWLIQQTGAFAAAGSDPRANAPSVGAKNLIIHQPWRGNVREMQATLLRAALWCHGDTIEAMELQRAFFSVPNKDTNILARDVSQSIDIQVLVGELVRH